MVTGRLKFLLSRGGGFGDRPSLPAIMSDHWLPALLCTRESAVPLVNGGDSVEVCSAGASQSRCTDKMSNN